MESSVNECGKTEENDVSQVIADIYELQHQIGAGGGGVVYLGRHLRLDKQVVLKADKRTLDTKPEVLRREVDMLKDLSHTYIPQVYDFVQENGIVYTVMDFIEGESLDKLLARGEIPSQPQVIGWACQLLEALSYLHNRPPHGILHGDIKPANIMLRPSGDICLIDYNIALALGEDGAVKAGFSRGYASPEHYGIEYIHKDKVTVSRQDVEVGAKTQVDSTQKTEIAEKIRVTERTEVISIAKQLPATGGSSTGGQRTVMLDVRSDIYSLGATLYHLLSGHRPAQEARNVEPLGADVCRPEISAIIQKAMAPSPDMRYQSAEEMLDAFLQLHKCDKRVVRHKRCFIVGVLAYAAVFLLGGICSFVGLKQMEQLQEALTLSEYSANALAEGDVSAAVEFALRAVPSGKSVLEAPVTAQAQKALTDALGVYDLSDGFKALDRIDLPAAPFGVSVSPEDSYVAVVYAYEVAVFDMETQREIVTLPTQKSALSDVIFVDETHIIYAGEHGITAYDLGAQKVLWTGEIATTLVVSGDGSRVAAVNRNQDYVNVYHVSDGEKVAERSFDGLHMSVAANDIFADAEDDIFALNEEGSMLAVSFSNGGLTVFDLNNPDGDMIVYDESDYSHFAGGFCGKYFAFAADKSAESVFGLIDTEEAVYLGGYDSPDNFLLQADRQGIYLANGNLLVSFDPDTLEETELAYTDHVNITNFSVGKEYVLVAAEDNSVSFYDEAAKLILSESSNQNSDFVAMTDRYAVTGNRNEPSLRLWKLENHSETQLLFYDARYHHDEARISQDGETVVLFDYEGFCIYDMDGRLVTQVTLPDAEYIYDQQFTKSEQNSWLEVIWYDGMVRCYSAANGELLSETMGEIPSSDLDEEFCTEKYRIESSLHAAPKVYELETDRLVAVLEEDSYLTYVTQVGEYIVTEYISAAGERYGLLLDNKLETLAYLPGLCDIADGMLVFDDESGNLRQCRLYSLQELIAFGETYIIEN